MNTEELTCRLSTYNELYIIGNFGTARSRRKRVYRAEIKEKKSYSSATNVGSIRSKIIVGGSYSDGCPIPDDDSLKKGKEEPMEIGTVYIWKQS